MKSSHAFNTKVTLQTRSTVIGEGNAPVESWTTLATVYASKEDRFSQQDIVEGRGMNVQQVNFTINYREDFDESAKLIHKGVEYEILGLVNPGGKNLHLIIQTKKYETKA